MRFPGQYFDKETNLHYNYFRDYDPAIGRYIQPEPLGLAGDINLYRYARNNSLTYIDPKGDTPITAGIGAAIGGVAGAIQAANQNGGWSWTNAGQIAAGAAVGAATGAAAGATPAGWGWLGVTAAGAFAGFAGNSVSQLAGNNRFSWCQAGTQAVFGAASGLAGWGLGLKTALGSVGTNIPATVLARPSIVQNALAEGAVAGAIASGATQTLLNLPVPTALGGFLPSASNCGCNF